MSPEPSATRLRASDLSDHSDEVEGPLCGYHHETYAFSLSAEAGADKKGRWKIREPREELLWFDRRCFTSEYELLYQLRRRIDVIPEVAPVGGVDLQRFVEGVTLGERYPSGEAVSGEVVEQILKLFRQLIAVTSDTLPVERKCDPEDRADEGDSAGFLERLIRFTQKRVYGENLPEYEDLFTDLGLGLNSFEYLRKHVDGLTSRPFCLLHADLHRENFILDSAGKVWAIDWELAMLGDPLYDLATHLHLMRYPVQQEREIIQRWCVIAEDVRKGSSKGWIEDLPRLLDYKKAQSVFTDVIRETQPLVGIGGFAHRRLRETSLKVRDVLWAAAEPLGLASRPSLLEIEAGLRRWGDRGPKSAQP
ncbi:aminoglycoside phosphotransferase family protein [Streptomyces phaeochromogenes]|uniref:phosphotransferase n=1 Tax=Streptomyces phaeochromogenes TaxID=1923 RepID=UPI003862D976|nr:aminoglycoside phosphotransferase family protein [Streptomyces phaeochromogenes]